MSQPPCPFSEVAPTRTLDPLASGALKPLDEVDALSVALVANQTNYITIARAFHLPDSEVYGLIEPLPGMLGVTQDQLLVREWARHFRGREEDFRQHCAALLAWTGGVLAFKHRTESTQDAARVSDELSLALAQGAEPGALSMAEDVYAHFQKLHAAYCGALVFFAMRDEPDYDTAETPLQGVRYRLPKELRDGE